MPPRKAKRPALSEALFASIVEPRLTMRRLLAQDEAPPHLVAIALLFFLVCILPVLLLAGYQNRINPDYEIMTGVLLTTTVSVVLCATLAPFGIRAFGARNRYFRSIAALIYCTTPITVTMAIFCIASRLLTGKFATLEFLAFGFAQSNDLITEIFPYVFRASLVVAAAILINGLRTIGRSSYYVGAVSAVITVMLLLGSFIIGLTITDLVYPSLSTRTIEFFARYFSYPR
jgi:hypothetical protein